MMNPEFAGKTAEDVAEQAGRWLRAARGGAEVFDLCLILMKTTEGSFEGRIGSRRMLIAQVSHMDPTAGANLARDLTAHRDRLPVFGLDALTEEGGLTWLDPLPNSKGGAA